MELSPERRRLSPPISWLLSCRLSRRIQTVTFTHDRMPKDAWRRQITEVDDTIQMLCGIRQSIDRWVPQTTTRPDALIAHLNDLYAASTENRDFDELLEWDDVGSPSITLIVSIKVEFDGQRVMENMRTRLHITQPDRGGE